MVIYVPGVEFKYIKIVQSNQAMKIPGYKQTMFGWFGVAHIYKAKLKNKTGSNYVKRVTAPFSEWSDFQNLGVMGFSFLIP